MVLVDSKVLLGVIQDDPQWADWSAAQIERLADAGELAINPIIFAEVSVAYAQAWEVDQMLGTASRSNVSTCLGKPHSSPARPSWPIASAAAPDVHPCLTSTSAPTRPCPAASF